MIQIQVQILVQYKYMIKSFKIFENFDNVITLYHGTCDINANHLVNNGFKPNLFGYGGNMGDSKYLYLSSDPEDALWFAEQRGCKSIVEVKDIPLNFLKPDPDDESGYTIYDLLDRMKNSKLPSKFVLIKDLDKKHFKLYND